MALYEYVAILDTKALRIDDFLGLLNSQKKHRYIRSIKIGHRSRCSIF